MARKRIKSQPEFRSKWVSNEKISFVGLTYTPMKYRDKTYSKSFLHLMWSWKYRILPDNTIRWRIVT